MAQREKLDECIAKALVREYPVGSIVHWYHGRNVQNGKVTEHWGTTLRARNVNTGKYKDLNAGQVHWYAQQIEAIDRKDEKV
jgi:hypothetical protein